MTLQVFAIRPEPGLSETLAAAAALGLAAAGEPLFAVEPVAWEPVDPQAVDAVLAGSANAFRHGGEALEAYAGKPVHAVGEKTAEAARAAGFTVATVGEGGLQAVIERLEAPLRLFRPAGEARTRLAPPKGVSLVERTVYRSVAVPMPDGLAADLRGGGAVLLHSAEAGRHFAVECDRLAVPRARLGLLAIGPRVLEAVGTGWHWTAAAPRPDEAALLVLARDMCLTPGGSKNGR